MLSVNTVHYETDQERDEDRRRRMKAALALTGKTVPELAELIDQRNYGAKTLYNLQSGQKGKTLRPADCRTIAEALGISPAFFTVDFATLGKEENGSLREEVGALAEAVLQLAIGNAEEALSAARTTTERLRDGTSRGTAGRDRPPGLRVVDDR